MIKCCLRINKLQSKKIRESLEQGINKQKYVIA